MKYVVLKSLLLALLSVSSTHAYQYSQKTFLMPRAVGVNKAMEHTTWHSHIYKNRCHDHNLYSHFQITPFYQHSMNRDEVGRYFGLNRCGVGCKTNSFTIGDGSLEGDQAPDIDGSRLIGGGEFLSGTVTFNPDQEIFGSRFDFFQYFNTPWKGLFFKASFPLVHVSNDMNMCISGDKAVTLAGHQFTLRDFFAGNVRVEDDQTFLRDPLTHAKICGRRSATGVADLDLALGYRYFHSEKRHVLFNVLVTIPTGNKVRGEYLFEPIYGNGQHAGLGVGIDGSMQMWQGKQGEVWFDAGVQYKYLFEGTERRTLGINGMPFGHYFLMSSEHIVGIAKPFFPGANELTRQLRVQPGSQFDALAHFSFKCCEFVADIGYNLYWKDKESVWVKCWPNNTFGIIADIPATNSEIIVADDFIDAKYVNTENLDVNAVRTPAQLTHKIHGGIAYRGNIYCRYPASIALGASYEFAEDNSALEQYAVWLKAGFSV